MMENKNQGFTLIEMLVVVAVIGLLSSVLLNSLGPAKEKTKDTRIIQEINQIRSLAETLYDGTYRRLPEVPDEEVTNEDLKQIIDDINQNGGDVHIIKSSDEKSYIIYTPLNYKITSGETQETQYYCVDSAGRVAFFVGQEPDKAEIKRASQASCRH